MHFPTSLSSSTRPNPQDGQDLSLGMPLDEANDNSNIQYAAGGVRSSPLASTGIPSVSTSFDRLRALLSTYLPANANAGRGFGLSESSFDTSSPGSELSSSSSSSPPSSMTSPVSEELSFPFASPDLPFHDLSMNDEGLLQDCQYPLDLSFLANDQPYATPPEQPFTQPAALPEEPSTGNVPILTDQCVGINDTSAFPGNNTFLAVPSFPETTALGLYYPSTPQGFQIPPLSIQADASILSAPPPAPPTEPRKVRAVAPPAPTTKRRVRSGKNHLVATAAAAAAAIATAPDDGMLKCPICVFSQSTLRKGDFLRHMRTHEDAKLTRYVCCGIPVAHHAAAGLVPGHPVRLYKGSEFVGGCGRSYSRMDALQRHQAKSGCAGGSAKDHQIWRQLYL